MASPNLSAGRKFNALGSDSTSGIPSTEVFWVVIFEGTYAGERKKRALSFSLMLRNQTREEAVFSCLEKSTVWKPGKKVVE